MLKRILGSRAGRAAVCATAAAYVRLLWLAGGWRHENDGPLRDRLIAGQPVIVAFWHRDLLLMGKVWPGLLPLRVLISEHRDGRLIAGTLERFGLKTITGSSSRGGREAFYGMLDALAAGDCVGITPDGPRGPRMRAASGVVGAARRSGMPIFPCATSPRRRWVAKSWDRFQVAKPWTRGGLILWGDPIFVADGLTEAELEDKRLEVENAITALSQAADSRMGHVPVEPAPPGPRPEKVKKGAA